jgi:hypothetical protein
MRRRYALAMIVALFLAVGTVSQALAAPITYRLGLAASGVVDGKPFTNQQVSVRLRTDTKRVRSGTTGSTLRVDCGGGNCTAVVAGESYVIGPDIRFRQDKDRPQRITVTVVDQQYQRLVLVHQRFASYELGTPVGPLDVAASFSAPLILRVTKDGRPTTIRVGSIANGRIRFEAK